MGERRTLHRVAVFRSPARSTPGRRRGVLAGRAVEPGAELHVGWHGMAEPVAILLVSGSTRAPSTNTAALRTLRDLAPPEVMASLYEGLDLPAFNPDNDQDPSQYSVVALRQALDTADVVVFCTAEYAVHCQGA